MLIFCLVLTGCATQSFTMNDKGTPRQASDTMQSFFISGIGQEQTQDASDLCGGTQNVYKVEVQQSPLDCLLQTATFGLYTPRHVRVYCTAA